MNNKKFRIFANIIGLLAIIAIIALVALAMYLPTLTSKKQNTVTDLPRGFITFETDELIYDGTKPLDLMEGVKADDGNGKDITSTVNAIITSDGTQNRKIIRYTCFDALERSVSATRSLVMKNYTGPSLEVSQPLTIDSSELDNLIPYLQSQNLLKALDGYGKNISSAVTCQRELISTGLYKMTFHVINSYQDEKTVVANVRINGKVDNPSITLYSNSVSVPMGRKFDPMSFVVSQSSCVGKIDIDSTVNTLIPGNYRVTFTVYSNDMTAKSTKIMQVTVTGNANG